MEVKRSGMPRQRRLSILAAAALTLVAVVSAEGRPSFQLTLGASGFLPSQAFLRELYGDVLLGLQARASWRFAGGFTAFAGYRSVRADGTAKVLGPAFDSGSNGIRLDLASLAGRLRLRVDGRALDRRRASGRGLAALPRDVAGSRLGDGKDIHRAPYRRGRRRRPVGAAGAFYPAGARADAA